MGIILIFIDNGGLTKNLFTYFYTNQGLGKVFYPIYLTQYNDQIKNIYLEFNGLSECKNLLNNS